MLQLHNNCRAGDFTVRPKNWKTSGAKVNTIWKISYWFYDDNLNQRKCIVIKGMNRLKTLREKQEYTQSMIEYEMDLIQVRGWNHIIEAYSLVSESEITGYTPVVPALEYAFTKLHLERRSDVKSAMKYISGAIKDLHYDRLTIAEVKRRHIKKILEKCGEGKGKWGPSSYNHYRSYLRMLFKELLDDAVETNPVNDLAKKKETRKIRQELTKEERARVRKHLSLNHPEFWTFVNIFFHSGSRETELLRLTPKDVDLENRRFKVLVKKGQEPREEWRPIKDIVAADWEKALEGAKETDYIFSIGLGPGSRLIRVEQITRRWRRHVKKKLGITADLYSLKHSNLDETAEALQKHKKAVRQASEQAGHTTPVVTLKHYLQGEGERQNATVRGVWNEF